MQVLALFIFAAILIGLYFTNTWLQRRIQPRKNGQRLVLYLLTMLLLMAACAVAGGWLAIWLFKLLR